jgi:hypothetical protein
MMTTTNQEFEKNIVKRLRTKIQFCVTALLLFFALTSNAQVSINVNIGSRPDWCRNYNAEVEYFYYPEIEAYYNINAGIFIYYGPRGWIRSSYLPEYCNNYDFQRGYKVVLDYRGNAPYTHFTYHKKKYYRNNCRNYREEYYHPRQCDNNRYVVVSHDRDDDDDDDHYYKKEKKHKHHDKKGHGHRR